MPPAAERLGVVLIGHGAPALDCPPQLLGELMSLQWSGQGASHHHTQRDAAAAPRAEALDAQIRNWPRHAGNDPYQAGLERLADTLRPLLPTDLFAVGYNEFCRPTIAEAIEHVIQRGARRVLVLPTMMTPGGVHSEQDIPKALAAIRQAHPAVAIEYLWPFDLGQVAALLAAHVRRALSASCHVAD